MHAPPTHVEDCATRACNTPLSRKGEVGKPGWGPVSATVPGDLLEQPASLGTAARKRGPLLDLSWNIGRKFVKSPFLPTPPRPRRAKKQKVGFRDGQAQRRARAGTATPELSYNGSLAASSSLSLIHQQPPCPQPEIPLGLPASAQARGL